CHNRVMFKQLLQMEAASVVQIDAARVGGVNENLAILALAKKFEVPVCPHAGGVGLCEMVRHLAFFDYVGVSTSLEGRTLEWVDHLHEHFVDPATVTAGRYEAPHQPGMSAEMKPASVEAYRFVRPSTEAVG
ncbi:MAG: enolase C-terminal domain-like protein, partial [Actinomycetota bacterium]